MISLKRRLNNIYLFINNIYLLKLQKETKRRLYCLFFSITVSLDLEL